MQGLRRGRGAMRAIAIADQEIATGLLLQEEAEILAPIVGSNSCTLCAPIQSPSSARTKSVSLHD